MPVQESLSPSVTEAARLFHFLGDPGRLRLLLLLSDRDEVCVGELVEAVGLAQPTVSNHLQGLRLVGLVGCRREGRRVFYRLNSPLVSELLERVGVKA